MHTAYVLMQLDAGRRSKLLLALLTREQDGRTPPLGALRQAARTAGLTGLPARHCQDGASAMEKKR